MVDADKRELFAERAESLLLCMKQRFPGLPQTTLDMSKIQYNKVNFNPQTIFVPLLHFIHFLSNKFELNCYLGCWEIHFRKLFQSFRELGI